MNQTDSKVIFLSKVIGSSSAFGNDEGREAFQKLAREIDLNPIQKVFCISLKGLTRTDASFPRESVISLAKARKGEIGIFLTDFESKDLMDNWDYGAKAKDQSIIVVKDDGIEVLGPRLSPGLMDLLNFIIEKREATTSLVAAKLGISSQNASGKLKKLLASGLLLATKEVAETGGIEFIYRPTC